MPVSSSRPVGLGPAEGRRIGENRRSGAWSELPTPGEEQVVGPEIVGGHMLR
jgi:hypothetical protein